MQPSPRAETLMLELPSVRKEIDDIGMICWGIAFIWLSVGLVG